MNHQIKLMISLIFLCFGISNAQEKSKLSKPEKDFETFWTSFNDNYAFFRLKGVNWDEIYKKYRPLVTDKTKEKELVKIFSEMVEPFKDSHITISKGDEVLFKVKKPSYFKQEFKDIESELWKTVFETLRNNNFSEIKGIGPTFKDQNLYYATQNSEIGYIRISRCFANIESLFDDKKESNDTTLMLTLFDSILNSFSNTKGIIIDIRANSGGHGGNELASRFVKEKFITHYKAIRQKGDHENFTELEPIFITPNIGVNYLKPIVILTNDKTASSAEDFAISLYNQNNVTTIGTNTSGMLSDMFETQLSNKISFTLSNQRYYSIDKMQLEDIGVPVKIEIKNSKKDIENNIDPIIIEAIKTLR